MKIKLLNNGLYSGMDKVNFPVEVDAQPYAHGYRVSLKELKRIGADMRFFKDPFWPFLYSEVEGVE